MNPLDVPAAGLVVYPDRAAWLADARTTAPDWSIGGTTAADILGVGFGGPWRAWANGQAEPEPVAVNAAMRAGTAWEPMVLAWYGRRHDRETWAPLCRVGEDWLRPSPDGFAVDQLDGPGGLEVKCPRRRDGWGPDGSVVWRAGPDALGVVPPGYLVQVYAGLAASGLPWWDVVPCFGPHDTRTIRVLADPGYQERLVETLGEWREQHLVRGEPPDIDASSACSAYLARDDRAGAREATDAEADLVVRYAAARVAGKRAESERRGTAAELLAAMGDTKTILVDLGGDSPARFTAGARGPVLTGA